jgi:methyl-accepting chemotaxis protein
MATYRRGIILINKPFQFRFVLYVCSWLVVLSIIYPFVIWNLFTFMISMVSEDPNAPQVTRLFQVRDDFLRTLVLMQGAMLAGMFLISLFMSHRIAGPLFKLRRFFIEARDGNLTQTLAFRKYDYFKDLVQPYNEMMTSIRARIAAHQLAAADSIPKIEKVLNQCSPEVQHELSEVLNALRTSKDSP